MKLITINTHSLEEPDYERKLHQFAAVIQAERPEVLAMQEVNQSAAAACMEESGLSGFVRSPGFTGSIRQDNHGARLAELLREKGVSYAWTWVPAKLGYGKYDEGLAVFSSQPVCQVDSFRISRCDDYENWKTRRVLGIKTREGWFYTVHMGWWEDEEEPFEELWERLEEHLKARKKEAPVWLMGDFNSPDSISGQGYDLVRRSGWQDTYHMAEKRDQGITVSSEIDGWRDRGADQKTSHKLQPAGMRIDYIWCSKMIPVKSSCVICNGIHDPVVSDHFGVMVQL